jgi:hypothetical protein
VSRATEQRAFEREVLKAQNCIDMVFHIAVGATKVAGIHQQEVARICVSAACRRLEHLIEKQHRAVSGAERLSDTEQSALRTIIVEAATDLKTVLEEGLAVVAQLTAYSHNLVPAPEKETERPVES